MKKIEKIRKEKDINSIKYIIFYLFILIHKRMFRRKTTNYI